MLSGMNDILSSLDDSRRKNIDGQLGLFDFGNSQLESSEPDLPLLDEFSSSELLTMEKETTGLFLSGHPMFAYTEKAESLGCTPINSIFDEDAIVVAGLNDERPAHLVSHEVLSVVVYPSTVSIISVSLFCVR